MRNFEVILKAPIKAVCEENVKKWVEHLVLPCLNEHCSDGSLVADVEIKEIIMEL